jgi:cell shape-determining protein MreC
MKKTFLVRRNALLSSTNISWGTIALIAAIFFLLGRFFAPNIFWYAFTPAFRISDALAQKSHSFFSSFRDAAALASANEQLVRGNALLTLQNESLRQKIESITGLADETWGITAGVIARPPESPYDTLVLAAGSEEGVAPGQEAFGEGNIPLGVVSSVHSHFSRVTLFSAPGTSLLGWVGHERLPLVLKGTGAGSLSASVPRSAGVIVGDIVSVPGPGALAIGTVTRIDSDPSSPSVTLRILPSLNLFSITWVMVRDVGGALRGAFSSSTPLLP